MAARGSRKAQTRTEAERARLHAARTRWHQDQIRRRTRDNVIAITGGALIVVGAVVSQVVHAQVTAPEPTPPPSSSIAPSPAPSDAPSPVPTAPATPTE